jgi:hypothetical protein
MSTATTTHQWEDWTQRMLDWHGLVPADGGRCCPRRLLPGKHCVWHRGPNHPDPCLCDLFDRPESPMDHTRMWRDGIGRLIYTTEPYGVTDTAFRVFSDGLAAHGIEVRNLGSAHSPWFPGHTTLLMLTAAEPA